MGAVRIRDGKPRAIRQLLAMQEVLLSTTLNPETKPLERASCARAWKELEDQKRILRGKLKPGSVNASQVSSPQVLRRKSAEKDSTHMIAQIMRKELDLE